MSFLKIRNAGLETKYSILSLLSLSGVLILHFVHWISVPLLMGAAEEMHTHHHEMGSNGSFLMSVIMPALIIVNMISMYFAVRQLIMVIKKDGKHTKHTMLCSGISIVVLCMGIYTLISL